MVRRAQVRHPDRWLVWTVVIAIGAAIISLWAIEMFSIDQDIMVTSDEVTYALHIRLHKEDRTFVSQASAEDGVLWRNATYGFEFFYPKDWRVAKDSPGESIFENKIDDANYARIFAVVKQKKQSDEFLYAVQKYGAARKWTSETHEISNIGGRAVIELVNNARGFDPAEYTPRVFFAELSDTTFLEMGVSYSGGMKNDAERSFSKITHGISF